MIFAKAILDTEMIRLNFLILCAFFALTGAFKAPALSTPRFPELPSKEKSLSMSLQSEFFYSDSNHLKFGQWKALNDQKGNYFQYIALHPRLLWTPFSDYIYFELFANSFWVKSVGDRSREVFRPSIAGGGLGFYNKWKNFYAGLELRGGIPVSQSLPDIEGVPLSKNFQTPDELIVGDDSYFVEPGVWLYLQPFPSFYLYYNVSFRHRIFSPLSSLLFNRLGGVVRIKLVDIGLSLDSFFSVLPDTQIQQAERRLELIRRVNAGSYRFYSFNPSLVSFTTWMEFKFQPAFINVYFNGSAPVGMGSNYARGLSVGAVAKFKWGIKSSPLKEKGMSGELDFNRRDWESVGSPSKKKDKSYFEEEKDPYDKDSMNQELKEELKYLRY